MIEFLVKSDKHSRFFKASSAEVAAKRFLNYLRRYTNDRPETLQIEAANHDGELAPYAQVTVEWYRGPLQASQFSGALGHWWNLKMITLKESVKCLECGGDAIILSDGTMHCNHCYPSAQRQEASE